MEGRVGSSERTPKSSMVVVVNAKTEALPIQHKYGNQVVEHTILQTLKWTLC